MAKFDKSVLEKYGITGTTEVVYNPSYEVLFEEETKEQYEAAMELSKIANRNIARKLAKAKNLNLPFKNVI